MIDAAARGLVLSLLRSVRAGRLELVETWTGRRLAFGPADDAPGIEVRVVSPAAYRLALRGSIGLGEAYADGLWEADDLPAVFAFAIRELRRHDPLKARLAPLRRPVARARARSQRNSPEGARRNISAHYDLGNEMFELFLDREWMIYSSARYERPGMTLEEAQETKLRRICERLELSPERHLLEIGTGWGGLALYAASRYGARVTTTTISRRQREYAEGRVRAAGLEDRIEVLGADYRELDSTYDRLVSIEMIEAVGWEYFDTFFERCCALLKPDGLMFLQAIAIEDRAYEGEKGARSFANTLIFPGGCLPSLAAMQSSVVRRSDMRPVFLEDIGPSYVRTLREWRSRFGSSAAQLEALGYDERFRRLWEMYFAMSEAGFAEARLRDLQIVYARPGWPGERLPQSWRPISVGSGWSSTPKASRTPSRSSRASATSS